MRRIVTAGLALMAMLAFGALSAGSAAAHLLLFTGAVGSLVLLLNQGRQIFTAFSGGTAIECEHLKLDGTVKAKGELTQKLVGGYTGCEAGGVPAEISPAEFEFSADETVKVLNTIVLIIPLAKCSIKISPPGNESLKTIRYLLDFLNLEAILAHAEVTGVTSFLSSTNCGLAGTQKEGEDRGLALIVVDAPGSLHWC